MEKFIITIGREFGSGGREVGAKIAEYLNIKYFDKELIEFTAKESGINQELFENIDEKRALMFTDGMFAAQGGFMGSFYTFSDTLSSENLFKHQMDAIKKIADLGSAVIVGRCADYVLRDHPNCLSVFIHCNDLEKKKERVKNRHPEIEEKAIPGFIKKADKKRANYYNYYTDQVWGDVNNYDLAIDTSKFGIEGSARFIADAIKGRYKG